MSIEEFPIGGPRQPVYDALKRRGFIESGFSDKWWKRRDGLEVHVYGTGSMLSVLRRNDGKYETLHDAKMADSLSWIDAADAAVGATP